MIEHECLVCGAIRTRPMLTETHAAAVARICTHRCQHFPTVIMAPDTCAKRMHMLRSHPTVLGPSVFWYCKNCSGAVPIDAELHQDKPKLPSVTEHDTRYLRNRVCKCCTCGTEDQAKFDRGHARKCRECVAEYQRNKALKRQVRKVMNEAENPRMQCCKCNRSMNKGTQIKALRLKLRLCGECFKTFTRLKQTTPGRG